jgi:hypothetical protein
MPAGATQKFVIVEEKVDQRGVGRQRRFTNEANGTGDLPGRDL